MDQFSQSPMQQHELTMRQMVEQIHLGKLNLDQAAVQFNVNRKTVRQWVIKVEQEAQANKQTAAKQPNMPPNRKKTAIFGSPPQREEQASEMRAKIHALEQELEVATFKALYYSTLIQVAEQELGVDIEKKSVTKPSGSY
jgi:transposase-like protein